MVKEPRSDWPFWRNSHLNSCQYDKKKPSSSKWFIGILKLKDMSAFNQIKLYQSNQEICDIIKGVMKNDAAQRGQLLER
jgi:hypothetical protein